MPRRACAVEAAPVGPESAPVGPGRTGPVPGYLRASPRMIW
jgi:hypothetical protein